MNLRYAALAAWMLASGAAHAVGGLADLEVYDRTDRRVLPVYWHAGKAWVEGVPGHEFRIRLRNATGDDVLAVVSVDGVNVVSGETADPGQTGYVLDAGASTDIQGWRKSLTRTAAFYFTDVPDAYATRTGRPDNLGVIGVAVFRRKAEPPPAPVAREEPWHGAPWNGARSADAAAPATAQAPSAEAGAPAARMRAEAKSSLGTGHGRSETSRVRYVDFERASPYPDEIVRLYYDRREQLISKGVIPAPRERDPEPFPAGFAADPPRGG
jgi:hypothetical protein